MSERLTDDELEALVLNISAMHAASTDPPWHLSPGGLITQTRHITRDVWTIPHCEEDMEAICVFRNSAADVLLALQELQAIRAAS